MSIILGSSSAYQPPIWLLQAGGVLPRMIPTSKLSLGCFPTPMQQLNSLPELQERHIDLWIKRDDLSSFDLSGNKVRKLEFLLADALAQKCDSIVTVGGIQSNHCKATAVAARQLGLQPHLILRTPKLVSSKDADDDSNEVGIVGNLLFDRMVNSKIYTISPGNYGRIGSNSLVNQLGDMLQAQGHNPYLIPVGGSCALGAFGYIECVREIMAFAAAEDLHFDHIVTACGSGGTAAGLALGLRLAGLTGSPGVSGRTQLHCIGVCDSPQYFYEHIREVATTLGVDLAQHGEMETWCKIYDGQGIGYARSTVEELQFLADLSSSTGLLLDPVYSGKAFHFMMHKLLPTEVFRQGQRVLFLHTGGTLGLYDKETQLLPILKSKRQVGDLLSALNGDTST